MAAQTTYEDLSVDDVVAALQLGADPAFVRDLEESRDRPRKTVLQALAAAAPLNGDEPEDTSTGEHLDAIGHALADVEDRLDSLVDGAPVVHHDAVDPVPFSLIVQRLIEESLERAPWRRQIVAKMRGAIAITEAEAHVSCTLQFDGRGIHLRNGVVEPLWLHIVGDLDSINQTTRVKVPVGFLTPDGFEVTRRLLTGRLRVRGMFAHPLLVLRLMRLLSIKD